MEDPVKGTAFKSDLKYRRGDRGCGHRGRKMRRCGDGNTLLISFIHDEMEVKV